MTREHRLRRVIVTVSAALLSAAGAVQAPAGALVGSDPINATPNFNDTVYAVARSGSTVYVGGEFTKVTGSNGTFTRRGAAAFDSGTGRVLRWNPRVAGVVRDIAVSRGTAYLGGSFTAVGGAARRNLAGVDARGRGGVTRLARSVNGPVLALAVTRTRLYLGGNFSRVTGKSRANLAAISRRAPYRLTRWHPAATGGSVRVLKRTRGGILAGGYFARMNGRSAYGKLAKVSKRSGALAAGFDPRISLPVLDIAGDRNKVYVAAGGPRGGAAAAFARTSGRRLWTRTFDGDVAAIARGRGAVYTGGHFVTVCRTNRTSAANGDCVDGGQRRARLAALQPDGDLMGWNPGADSTQGIWALTASRRRDWLAVGGAFTHVDGEFHGRLALLR